MRLENPGTILPLIMLVLVLGVGGCIYVIVRFFRQAAKGEQRPKPRPAAKKAAAPGRMERLASWLSDPVAGTKTQAPPKKPPPAATPKPPPVPVPAGDAVEIMRVLRVGPLGELVVEVEGQRYRQLAEIHNGITGRRVLLAIQELANFTGRYGRQALPEMHRYAPPAGEQPKLEAELSHRQQAFLGQLQSPLAAEEVEEHKVSLIESWRRRKPAEPEPEPKSFIDEIEDVLQAQLAGQPEMAGRSIHFGSTVGGELQIEVDGQYYQAVDQILEPQVLTLLRAAIQAWEQR